MSLAIDRPRSRCLAGQASGGAAPIWHISAPSVVRKALLAGDRQAAWKAWQKRLRNRRLPGIVAKQGALEGSLVWALTREQVDGLSSIASGRGAAQREAVERWLDGGDERGDRQTAALEAVAWCRALPDLAATLPAGLWWRLWERLLEWASDRTLDVRLLEEQPVAHQLLAGELALTLGYLFPELKPCRAVVKQARLMLSLGLEELLDGDGLLHARHFGALRPLLACWTRCRALASRWKLGCWSAQAEKQFTQFVRQAVGLSRRDGGAVFSALPGGKPDRQMLRAALALVGAPDDRTRASFVLADKSRGRTATRKSMPRAAEHSEWAAVAVLRPDWKRSAPRLTVMNPGTECHIELACGKDVLVSGAWEFELTVDGIPATPTSDWSENCWVSDADIDYLELEIELTHGLRLQRHLALARKESIAFLSDTVLGSQRGGLQYRGTLPLYAGTTSKDARETREVVLCGGKPRALVLPLQLPEWKDTRGHGEMLELDGRLELRQGCQGTAMFAPLFLDLNPKRFDKRLTWRQLTVAETLEVVASDAAVGYRVQIGRKQWLLYRSLTTPRNRTVLGHNLSTEMLLARFQSGEVEPLIEIE